MIFISRLTKCVVTRSSQQIAMACFPRSASFASTAQQHFYDEPPSANTQQTSSSFNADQFIQQQTGTSGFGNHSLQQRRQFYQKQEPVMQTTIGVNDTGVIHSQPLTSTVPFVEELDQDYSLAAYLFNNNLSSSSEGDGVIDEISSSSSPSLLSSTIINVFSEPVDPELVEIKPDGSLFLPEIRYRKALLKAFGPGGWCLIPRGPHSLLQGFLSREYALVAYGRHFISQARGYAMLQQSSQQQNNPLLIMPASMSIASITENVRSNALMRCCKDLGVASELWDVKFVNQWRMQNAMRRQDQRGKWIWVKKQNNMANSGSTSTSSHDDINFN